ncbi:MAG: hypothetical protein WAM82_32770 [Thermoanaerobaculia bacterium]
MSVERLTLDSNILFYSIASDAGERQEKAREIVRQAALLHRPGRIAEAADAYRRSSAG